jgi:hypothetical protein
MIDWWIVSFLMFTVISTTLSYVYGFSRGQEFGVNTTLDDLIDKGVLEVIEEDE